jgi:hypothetical protein
VQLRSGTTLYNEEETVKQTFEKAMLETLTIQKKYPVSSDINNLMYTLKLYEALHNYLRGDYINTNTNPPHNRFIVISLHKTIELMSQLIAKTYGLESIHYSNYTKTLIIKTLYKLHEVLLTLRYVFSRMEDESDYIRELLKLSIDKKGEKILNKSSIEAKVYYCYRYFYKSRIENNYNISSYEDRKCTEVEIYNYHFKENVSKYENDDLLIKADYKQWFVCEETTDRYDILPYDKCETDEEEHVFSMCELEDLRDFHKNELEKYENLMH